MSNEGTKSNVLVVGAEQSNVTMSNSEETKSNVLVVETEEVVVTMSYSEETKSNVVESQVSEETLAYFNGLIQDIGEKHILQLEEARVKSVQEALETKAMFMDMMNQEIAKHVEAASVAATAHEEVLSKEKEKFVLLQAQLRGLRKQLCRRCRGISLPPS